MWVFHSHFLPWWQHRISCASSLSMLYPRNSHGEFVTRVHPCPCPISWWYKWWCQQIHAVTWLTFRYVSRLFGCILMTGSVTKRHLENESTQYLMLCKYSISINSKNYINIGKNLCIALENCVSGGTPQILANCKICMQAISCQICQKYWMPAIIFEFIFNSFRLFSKLSSLNIFVNSKIILNF